MRLRVRSIDSKQTLKIEVPNDCTLRLFKQTLTQFIPSVSPLSISVSLNRKDELSGSSLDDPLSSLGVTSGDLIFYTLSPNVFNPSDISVPVETLLKGATSSGSEIGTSSFGNFDVSGGDLDAPGTSISSHSQVPVQDQDMKSVGSDVIVPSLGERENSGAKISEFRNSGGETFVEVKDRKLVDSGKDASDLGESDTLESILLNSEASRTTVDKPETAGEEVALVKEHELMEIDNLEGSPAENMDIYEETGSGSGAGRVLSVPYLLREVLRTELPNDCFDLRSIVIAVHAFLLESGFVRFDGESGNPVERVAMLQDWPLTSFTVSMLYTLPNLIDRNSNGNGCETVVIKFQSLGQFVNAYGSLSKNGKELYKVCMDGNKFVPVLHMVLGNSNIDNSNVSVESELYEFWKMVKDGLALPLLIDICDRAGLGLPACFMMLPTELKFKIVELLPGVDLARLGCVSSELRYLCSNSDIWKNKCAEEFGYEAERGTVNWKERFGSLWESRKARKRIRHFPNRRPSYFGPRIRRDPVPFGVPRIVGGDYDAHPGGLGGPRGLPARRIFIPNCNFGGLNN